MKVRFLLPVALLALCACDLTQGCDNEPLTPAGDLDRIGDAVMVIPPEGTTGKRAYVVLSNPEIQQLRVFDVLERSFVRAPNVYFPLSLPTGPATRRLAVAANDPSHVYALDSATDELVAVRITPLVEDNEDAAPPAPDFRVSARFSTGRAPGDVAVALINEELLAFVTLPAEGVVQVLALNLFAGEATEVARVALGDGSYPDRLEVDPTGDAVVVTDARLSSVAILRTEDLALDRRIEVGGPTSAVAIGRVDPGDGLAPVALVARRDQPELAALRLYRPGYREERYALLARLETFDIASAVFVSDAAMPDAVPCCALLSVEQVDPDEPTYAWGAWSATSGFFTYLRFDAERDPRFENGSVEPRAPSQRGLLRAIGFEEPRPGILEESWTPAQENDPQPTVEITPVDNFGDPPVYPQFDPELTLSYVYEGSPPGATNRRVNGPVLDGARYRMDVVPDGIAFESRDVRSGDVIRVSTANAGGSCPDQVVTPISDPTGNSFFLDDITDLQAECLNLGERRFTLFATGDFTVRLSPGGYFGRRELSDVGEPVEMPGLVATISAVGAPGRGSRLDLLLTQGEFPIDLDLARPPDFTTDGFGQRALLTSAIVSGSVDVRDFTPAEGTDPIFRSNRMFLSTGAGALLELEEGEILVERIAQHR